MEAAWQELRRAWGSAGDPVGIRGGSKGDPEQKWGIRISADLAAMGDPARPVNPFIILKAGSEAGKSCAGLGEPLGIRWGSVGDPRGILSKNGGSASRRT